MAKSSNVMARVEPEIKEQAESILSQLGLPVSVLINSLYRQIIMRGGVPFSMTVPSAIGYSDGVSFPDAETRSIGGGRALAFRGRSGQSSQELSHILLGE